MAEGLLFDTVGKILEVLASQIFHEIGLAYGVQDDISNLRDTVDTIQAVLLDAEDKHSRKDHAVTIWLRRLKDAVYAAEDLLDDFSTEFLRRKLMSGSRVTKEVLLFFSKYNQFAYALEMGRKIKAIRERLESIKNDRQFHLLQQPYERRVENTRRETHSFVHKEDIIGRDGDKNEIIDRLLDSSESEIESVAVIPIVGIGGLGKTAVAQLVYNDEDVKTHFNLRMWVCVSDIFDVTTIVEKMIRSATNRESEKLDLDQLQERLRGEIDGKRYLLVLDDVWNENRDKWLELEALLMNGVSGSKIVVTTRSERVARITSKLPFHALRGLPEDMSWSLFTRMAFEQGSEPKDSKLVQIGKDVVGKCAGVPLAIRTIGRLLYYNNTETYWLHFRDDELSKVPQEESDILPKLKLSYDHLPSPLKQCFAYCALFPKDYLIVKEQLVLLWMAQGFLGLSIDNQCPEDVGHEYFMSLLSRSFFQDAEYDEWGNIIRCKIHDLMHDLAESVAGTECAKVKLDARNVNERTHHISCVSGFDSSLEFPTASLRAKNLRTFLSTVYSSSDRQLNESYCNKIVSSFKCLRTLNLSNSEIETVPSLIGKLKHLRYFNLSHNADIKSLPDSVSRLLNLQTLDLSCCDDLVELPRDIGKMVSLRHLAIESCLSLTDMPNGLGQLTNLRTLPLFMVGRKTQLSQLNGLNKLRGSLRIENLGEKQNSRLANLEAKEGLQSLVLQWDANKTVIYIDDALLEGLKPHQNLKELTIIRFGGIRLSSWLSSVTNLTMIDISICIKCQYIPELDQLPSLKRLRLFKLSALEYISSSSPPSTTIFPSLEELRIFACPELKGWWRTDGSTTQTAEPPLFPSLSKLTIDGCPKLVFMPLYPSLEELSLCSTSSHPLQQTMMRTTNTAEPPFSKLKSLTIESIDDLETWPEEMMPNFPSIQNISIELCPKLISLPQRLNNATTLKTVGIYDCPNMAILPEGLQLQSLEIIQCPQLSERCGNNMAVDWPKIAHIPNIRIDNDLIQLGDAIN